MKEYIDEGGLYHRTDGPAIERANGTKVWYQHGILHRINGPAIITADGSEEWWVDGRKLTKFEVWVLTGATAAT